MNKKFLKNIWLTITNKKETKRQPWEKELAEFINKNSNNENKIECSHNHFIEDNIEVFFNAYIINQIIIKATGNNSLITNDEQKNIINHTNIINIKKNNQNKFSNKSKRFLIHVLIELGCAMSCVILEALIFETIEHAIEHLSVHKKILDPIPLSTLDKVKEFGKKIGHAIAHPFKEKSVGIWIFLAILIISVILLHQLTHKITDLCFKKEKQKEKILDLLVEISQSEKKDESLKFKIPEELNKKLLGIMQTTNPLSDSEKLSGIIELVYIEFPTLSLQGGTK